MVVRPAFLFANCERTEAVFVGSGHKKRKESRGVDRGE